MAQLQKTDLIFDPTLDEFLHQREPHFLTVLSGGNNNGKSLILKYLKARLGMSGYMIGTNRFYHVYHFSSAVRDPNRAQQYESQFNSNFSQEQFNYEQNVIDLNQIITGLSNQRRALLFDICGELLNTNLSLKKVDEDNDLSMRYIDMDGQNLSVSSTGARLLITVLGICMDDQFSSILIDEPELGLSPKVQQAFAKFLQDPAERNKYFPHLVRVILATHSHIFLDRRDLNNNFVVSKSENRINIAQIQSLNDFHRLQFNLLGNDLETMFFPSAILIVEGPTDHMYLDNIVQLRYPSRRITVAASGGNVKQKVNALRDLFGDLMKSPFRNRLFVVLDSIHQHGLKNELEVMGVEPSNIIIWERNGIEYMYPSSILSYVYAWPSDRVVEMVIKADRIELNGIVKTKDELCREIVKRLDRSTELPDELETKLLARVSAAIA